MLAIIFLALIALWFLEYIHIEGLHTPSYAIFIYNNTLINLWEILILILVVFAFIYMPNAIRIFVGILLILWILTAIGLIAITGFPLANVLVLAIIIGIIMSLLKPD